MLKDAASSAKPTKYVQNKCHGTNEGTRSMMNFAAAKCSAPKTAKGRAKHKLLKTTILSRPRACAISVFAAQAAIRKSKTLAPHIETTVRENSRNAKRLIVCMSILGVGAGQSCSSPDRQRQEYEGRASARDRGLVNDVVP